MAMYEVQQKQLAGTGLKRSIECQDMSVSWHCKARNTLEKNKV